MLQFQIHTLLIGEKLLLFFFFNRTPSFQLLHLNTTFLVNFPFVCLWYPHFLCSSRQSHKKVREKGKKENMPLNPSCWIWHSHLIVWGSSEEVDAHTQELLKQHRRSFTGGDGGVEGESGIKKEEWKEKNKEHRPSSELSSAPFRFIPHYSSVLSQA